MEVIPAIDIKKGNAVRLVQGRMEDDKVYGIGTATMAAKWTNKKQTILTPADVAFSFKKQGASILHIVDLNGAFEGRGVNDGAVKEAVEAVNGEMLIELGGGIRDMARIDTLFEMKIDRVIIGTAAVENPELVRKAIEKYGPEKVIVGIDAKNGIVATRGWAKSGNLTAIDLALDMKNIGVTRIIYTDISKDGMLTGPNINETQHIAEETGMLITASGGVSSLEDIRELKKIERLGVDSVIVGKALYEEKFTLSQAIKEAKYAENGFIGNDYNNYYRVIKNNFTDLFSLSNDVNRLCHRIMAKLKPHNQDPKEIVLTTLILQATSTFQSVILLAERGMERETSILLRSFIESFFTIVAICNDENLLYTYLAKEEDGKYRLFDAVGKSNGWEPYLRETNISNVKAEFKSNLNKYLKKYSLNRNDVKHFGPSLIRNRLTQNRSGWANLLQDFYVVYSLLCEDVHASPASLRSHFKVNDLNKIYKIYFGPSNRNTERTLKTAILAMIHIVDLTSKCFDISEETESIKDIQERLTSISNKTNTK